MKNGNSTKQSNASKPMLANRLYILKKMKNIINKIKAFFNKIINNKCGTIFYYSGCNCIDCNLQQEKELKEFYKQTTP